MGRSAPKSPLFGLGPMVDNPERLVDPPLPLPHEGQRVPGGVRAPLPVGPARALVADATALQLEGHHHLARNEAYAGSRTED